MKERKRRGSDTYTGQKGKGQRGQRSAVKTDTHRYRESERKAAPPLMSRHDVLLPRHLRVRQSHDLRSASSRQRDNRGVFLLQTETQDIVVTLMKKVSKLEDHTFISLCLGIQSSTIVALISVTINTNG